MTFIYSALPCVYQPQHLAVTSRQRMFIKCSVPKLKKKKKECKSKEGEGSRLHRVLFFCSNSVYSQAFLSGQYKVWRLLPGSYCLDYSTWAVPSLLSLLKGKECPGKWPWGNGGKQFKTHSGSKNQWSCSGQRAPIVDKGGLSFVLFFVL